MRILREVGSLDHRPVVIETMSFACLGVALVVAAVTRLGWPGLVQFEYDESWALSIASSIANGQSLPMVGIGSSLNVPNAPFFVYLMALPELLGRDPSIATGFVGLLGTAAIAATYGFARSLFGPIAAGAAAILYAVSPWGIIYSRKVWEQDTLPIFVTLGFWALFASLLRGKHRLIAPGVILLALATQLHPTAYFLALPAVILVVGSAAVDRSRSMSVIFWLVVGLLLAFATEAPFILWQARHSWPTIEAIRQLTRDPGQLDLSALREAASAIAGDGYALQAQTANPWKLASVIEAALLTVGIVSLGARALRPGPGAPRLAALAILAWLASPVLAQTHHSVPLYPHYFIVLYPIAFVVMGVGVTTVSRLSSFHSVKRPLSLDRGANSNGRRSACSLSLWERVGVRVRTVRFQATAPDPHPRPRPEGEGSGILVFSPKISVSGLLLAAATVIVPLILGIVAFGDYVSALERGATLADFGVPLGQQQAFYAEANRLANGGTVYFGTHGGLSPTLGYLSDERWRIFDDRHGLHLPNGDRPSILAIDDPGSAAGQLAERWLGSEQVAALTLSAQTTVTLYQLAPGGAETVPGYHPVDVAFANGMTLSGFRVASDPTSRKLSVDLHWRFDGAPSPKSPTVFNHLVDSGGETVSGADGLAYNPSSWRVGEICLDQFDLAWPAAPGPYHLQVGLYDYPSMQRFRLLRPTAFTAVDWYDLGPVSLEPDKVSS